MSTDREECHQCGKTWGVTMTPRTDVICSDCARIPRLPGGEVRREVDGTLVVCLGGDWWLRWKVVGEDPHRITMHGWRADSHVMDCERVGNIHDLLPAPPSVESGRPPRFVDVELPLNPPAEEPAAPQAPAEPTGQFYEDDEPAAKVRAAFEQGPHLITAPPNTAAAPARVAPAAREDTAPPDVIRDVLAARDAVLDAPPNWLADNPGLIPPDDYGDNLTAGFLRAPVGACSCQPTAAVIHVPGTYCGDTQYEQAVDAMRATTGRPGDERDEEAVSAVLGYLANPTPEEKQ